MTEDQIHTKAKETLVFFAMFDMTKCDAARIVEMMKVFLNEMPPEAWENPLTKAGLKVAGFNDYGGLQVFPSPLGGHKS